MTDEASLPADNHTNLETSVTGLFESRLVAGNCLKVHILGMHERYCIHPQNATKISSAALPASPQDTYAEELICQLRSIGKLAVSRKEAQQLIPYSGRTFRRFEQRNLLPRLKGTRRVVYAASDLINLIREMR